MEGPTETAGGVWTTPECPFRIEYVQAVLDEIRLSVVDAFFSIPRGGAEVGGILFGTYTQGRVNITSHRPLDCEHAFGPGFTLSIRDRSVLADILAEPRPASLRPVGWYHSHTRSEIFLSEADLEIYNSYFPELWQVALVVKPYAFQPARAGFFFRAHGDVQRSASYLEFAIEAVAAPAPVEKPGAVPERRVAAAGILGRPATGFTVQQELALDAPIAEPAMPVESVEAAPPVTEARMAEPVITPSFPVEPVPAPKAPPPAVEVFVPWTSAPPPDLWVVSKPPPPDPPEETPGLEAKAASKFDVPDFLRKEEPRTVPRWVKMAVPLVGVLLIGLAAFATRAFWAPQLASALGRVHGSPAGQVAQPLPLTVGLSVAGSAGQLQIRWNPSSPAFRNAGGVLLEILDSGAAPRAIPLDAAHLRSGSFTYTAGGEKVDVVLVIEQPNGREIRETTTFLGRPELSPNDAATLRKQQEALEKENSRLQADLKAANDRSRKLQKSLTDARELLRIRQRLTNQTPK